MTGFVDNSSPEVIRAAIHKVRVTPGLRIKPGWEALLDIFKAQHHTLAYDCLRTKYGMLSGHFGWFGKRVANELGDFDPPEWALVDDHLGVDGQRLFRLKPSVVAAMILETG